MSFGFDQRCPKIEKAIDEAVSNGVLFFASASNYGALRPVTFPARHQSVICIHAMTGKGCRSNITTTGRHKCDNFATVGCSVPTWSVREKQSIETICSGSSVATAIATGIGACIIEMMRCARSGYLDRCANRDGEEQRYDHAMAALKKRDGIEAVLRYIVNYTGQGNNQGYSFLAPARFLCTAHTGHDTTKIDNILHAIEQRGAT